MKNLILLASGLFLLTLWSCSSDNILSDQAPGDVTEGELEIQLTEASLVAMEASLTDVQREEMAAKKAQFLKIFKQEMEAAAPQKTAAALRTAVKGAMTVAMNVVISVSAPCPSGATLERFRTFSTEEFFEPSPFLPTGTCTESNDYVAAVTAVIDQVLLQQTIYGDCDYNPAFTVNVVKSGDCFWTRLVWRGWRPVPTAAVACPAFATCIFVI